MFVTRHTARQQSRSRISNRVVQAFSELELPFLAPAVQHQLRYRPVRRSLTSTRNPSPSRSSTRPQPPQRHHTATPDFHRQLATAADIRHFGNTEEHIPFEGLSIRGRDATPRHSTNARAGDSPLWQRSVSDLVHFDPYHNENSNPTFRVNTSMGIPMEMQERLHHFYACLQVGRLDRAQKLILDLQASFQPHAPELINAHEQYVEAQLNRLIRDPSPEQLQELHRWYELDLLAVGMQVTPRILSTMMKASFICLSGSKLDRTLRRYFNQAIQAGSDVQSETLASSLFSDGEVAKVMSLLPDEYEPFPLQVSGEEEDLDSIHLYAGDAPLSQSPAYSTDSQAPGLQHRPELHTSEQKGLGLSSLKASLSTVVPDELEDPDPEVAQINRLRVQEALEKNVLDSALDRWRSENDVKRQMRVQGVLQHPSLGSHVYEWVTELTKLIEENLSQVEAMTLIKHDHPLHDLARLAPMLRMMPAQKIAAATVLAFVSSIYLAAFDSSKRTKAVIYDLPLTKVATTIGKELLSDIQLEQADSAWKHRVRNLPDRDRKRLVKKLYRKQAEDVASAASSGQELSAETLQRQARLETLDMNMESTCRLGLLLYQWLQDIAKLPHKLEDGRSEMRPVASIDLIYRGGKRLSVVNFSDDFTLRLKREPSEQFVAKHLPMLVEPRPWKSLTDGAYLRSQSSAFRQKDHSPTQMEYMKAADSRGDLKNLYASLDVIGKVPWRVNGPLFETMTEIWNSGEGVGNFAPESPNEDVPPEPSKEDTEAYARWKEICRTISNEATGLHSQRCYQNMQLEVARALLNKDFYCPHSIDFRGRAYPIPPYFNHMGADTARGLFMFARGKPLGETGLRWLKIHLANMFGYDKASLKDREQFANDHLSEIYDSANHPLHGKRWWLQSDECWQTLAACIELRNALDSPVPSEFVSHLPIQQDGSCNGLQHYAALGGDEIGARQVNLAPGDRPADIYTAVAELVKKYVAEDAKNGVKAAQIMDGRITRKVVKQPVMTNVYGVTFMGASRQVRKQLVDILPKATLDNDIHIASTAAYIAGLIFRALAEMFNGAYAIQKWLGDCGARISSAVTPEQVARIREERSGVARVPDPKYKRADQDKRNRSPEEDYQFKSTIVWTTPLGLPVVQPYRDAKVKTILTNTKAVNISLSRNSDPVNKRKQLQAFPPNFIHSLDATHMMLSALKCNEVGLQFSSVHDSFWTHAADVPVMNRVLRDAFVQMHSEDIVGRLREEFVARYKGCMLWTSVDRASPAGQKLWKFYKSTKTRIIMHVTRPQITKDKQIDLMLEEVKRMELMQSEDVEDQVAGQEMVTAASVVEAAGGEAVSADADEVMEAAREDADGVVESHDGHASVEDAPESAGESAGEAPPPVAAAPSSALSEKEGKRKIFFWKQITFPAAPQKGTFDVKQLKDSQYFFS